MRVLSVSNFFDTHGGGLERVAAHLNREFAAAGHEAIWAASDADGLPDSSARLVGLRCVNPTEKLTGLPMPIPGPRSMARLYQAVRGADVVLLHDALYVTSILAMIFAKVGRKPVIMVQHIGFIPFAGRIGNLAIRLANLVVTRPMMAAANCLAFISASVRDDLLGVPPRRQSLLVFNGVDQSIFHARPRSSAREIRERWGLPVNTRLAVFAGRFVEKKGLRVIKELAGQRPDLHFALFGQGPMDPHKWKLPNVHVLGQQPQSTIADLYRASDMLLLPSVGEGYPLVIQEAMACGLPVICGVESARADPAASEWLTGVEIDPGDPVRSARNCAAAIDRLRADPDQRSAMAHYAATSYRWDRMASELIENIKIPASA